MEFPLNLKTAKALDADLLRMNAAFAMPATLVALVGWADKILSE